MTEPIRALRPRTTELLRGDLRDVSLVSLLQLAQVEAISGWLRIEGRGEITLLKGHVGLVACGRLSGVEALRELAFHDRGRFVLARGEPAGDRCGDNVTFALMDAYRLRDEWKRLADAVLRRVGERPWKPTGGPFDPIVLELDGRRTLAELVDPNPGIATLVIDAALDALRLGAIERVPEAQRRPPPLTVIDGSDAGDPEDPDDLLDRGRDLARRGDYDGAEALLRRALARRPDDRIAQQNLRALARRRAAPGPETEDIR
ncbi:DUF4388 domain-containing protein [Nannocystis bainbridge]|uniref:DUF4388 domain-containing protein n=1 Tax=Nannocystis bainbridge TaxID=2995303 RepID=A0ABT5E6D9_9BACT|nr:DUF4388 domain-containing protein [Nannocystis bainbridge]MDC0720331.1 DUF4388 domain-containing protein [Nannocystis bainbridge]